MSEFLVETYSSREATSLTAPHIENVARAAERVSEEGTDVRFLRAILLPADETCFYLYRSESPDAVREAAIRAGLRLERIAEAVSRAQGRKKGGRPPESIIQEATQ